MTEELFTLLPLIEEVLRGFEACKIVISSSWREVHPLDELREFFAPDMRPRHRRNAGSSLLAWNLLAAA
jgi:hypothetical protein